MSLKAMLQQALDSKFNVYFEILKKFLKFKLTKKELDNALITVLAQDQTKIAMHNAFISGLLQNAHRAQEADRKARGEKRGAAFVGHGHADNKRRRKEHVFTSNTPALRALKKRMLENAQREKLSDVTDEAVELMYRAVEHRMFELLLRSRPSSLRLAPPMPSLHVVPQPVRDEFEPHSDDDTDNAEPSKGIARVRSSVSVRCAGVLAPIDMVRALIVHYPLMAQDDAVNRERASLAC